MLNPTQYRSFRGWPFQADCTKIHNNKTHQYCGLVISNVLSLDRTFEITDTQIGSQLIDQVNHTVIHKLTDKT